MIHAPRADESQLTLTAVVERAEHSHANREVVTRRPNGTVDRTTLGECAIRSRRLAGALAGLGIADRDAVATLLWNQAEHLELHFAVPAMGAVLLALDPRRPTEELVRMVADARARIIVVDDSLLGVLAAFAHRHTFEQVIVVGNDWPIPPEMLDYQALIGAAAPIEWPRIDEKQPAAMYYTSDGAPEPVRTVHSHRALVLRALAVALPDELGVSARDTLLPVLPLFRVEALGLPYAAALIGARLILPGLRRDPVGMLNLIAGESVTVTVGDLDAWLAVLAALNGVPRRWDLSRLDRLIVGGVAVARSVFTGFERHGVRMAQAWSMTAPMVASSTVPTVASSTVPTVASSDA
ncbi:AMP-binding protein [Nocardia sp. SYP-A9097]|uniref:AMP-binding protein n=1 Tax=Nocardia sp. SYP-A9097 TaxID=2663237 RepID=UPI00189118FA|nr:AMP-binding protein [Nocardia sp. SYP-A9097]